MSRYRGGPPTTLYVRNISDRVRYDDLRRLFMKYGKLIDVTIPLDYYSGMPKGFAFVEFEDPRDAEEAQYRMDRQRLFGKEIEVEFARGERKTSGEMRTRAPGEMRTRDRDSRYYPGRGGSGRGGGRMDDYGRDYGGGRDYGRDRRITHSRSRSRGGADERRRERVREQSGNRSKSRSRSYSKNRTPSPRVGGSNNHGGKSLSRSRSPRERSPRDRSRSRERRGGSPRRGSPKQMNSSRDMNSQSPA